MEEINEKSNFFFLISDEEVKKLSEILAKRIEPYVKEEMVRQNR